MKLKTRIIVSFFVIIFVPVLFTGITFCSMMHIELEEIGQKYGIENPTYENLINNTLMLNKMTEDDLEEFREMAENNPEELENLEYLSAMNKKLLPEHSFLVVRKNENLYYNGSDKVSDTLILDELPDYGDTSAALDSTIYIRSKVQAMVHQIDFEFTDGGEGSVFIITYADRMLPQVKSLMIDTIIVVVVILVVTSFLMSLWIYHGVGIPINQLKKATQNIREGNLDFSVQPCGAQEVKELCQDFEEMRLRLKESAEEKINFDSGNKELISNISHDLKTPITAVKGYVEGIMDGVADTPEKMDRYIRTIYNKANEMDRLINELTFYSKIDTNRIPYTFSKIHVSDYFDDCVEEMNLELEAQGIEMTYFNYLEEDTIIIADAEQLKRVINNIVSNSIKYMDKPRGVINIRIRDVGDFIQVEIEDNGKGIAQKDLAKIFDRFYRTDASRNSVKGGSGIGLSIVKKILEDHGGQVWANSKEEVGTVMYFVLRKYQEVPADE